MFGRLAAFLRGFIEGAGDCGLTYEDSVDSPRSQAYDRGRVLRRRAR